MMGNYCETIPPKSVTATIFFTFTAERRSKMTIEVMNNEEKEMILFWLKKKYFLSCIFIITKLQTRGKIVLSLMLYVAVRAGSNYEFETVGKE